MRRISFFCLLTLLISCRDFVVVDTPSNEIVKDVVFTEDGTATSATLAMYNKLNSTGFANGGGNSLTVLLAYAADEMIYTSDGDVSHNNFFGNRVTSTMNQVQYIWGDAYFVIYTANSVIEGLTRSEQLTPSVRSQLMGEAFFVRAFAHFYLTNLYGNVPYITSTAYESNINVSRMPAAEVYTHILADLREARELLAEDYTGEGRVRPNKGTATAMLARVNLYMGNWEEAAAMATAVIGNPRYSLDNIDNIFRIGSPEIIWQLMTQGDFYNNSPDGDYFIPFTGAGEREMNLSPSLLNTFEAGDQRRKKWIDSMEFSGTTYRYPFKYKLESPTTPAMEYSILFRLSEQYLIRAEARANMQDADGARADINEVRRRADLGDLPETLTADQCLQAVWRERFAELFTEWGHRWFDLKRTGRSDAVLDPIKIGWDKTDTLLPIPDAELRLNKNLYPQNPGF